MMKRRDFIRTSGAGLAGAALLRGTAQSAQAAPIRGADVQIKKAVKLGMVDEPISLAEKFKLLKDLGFDGVELNSPNDFDRDEVLRARDAAELPIHGVVDSVHWDKTLGDPDEAVRAEGLDGLKAAFADAEAYGATTVLLVPAVVNEKISYAEAYDRSQAEIRKALPLAEEHGVKIALENVWNQFLLSPLEFARYIDEFESEWIGAYFDVGNIVNYGWPEQWVRTLGPRILKLDIKEFSREKRNEEGLWEGFKVEIGEGSVDWEAVVAALADVGYSGWATAEVPGGDRERLENIAERMDRVLPTVS